MTNPPKNFYKFLLFGIIVLVLFLLPTIAKLYADIAWYKGIGFYSVFIVPFTSRVLAGLAGFVLMSGILMINFWVFNKLSRGKLYISQVQSQRSTIIQEPKEVGKTVKKFYIGFALFVGLLAGLSVSGNWQVILKYFYQTPFKAVDPIFGYNLAYYIFTLPFIKLVIGFLFFTLILSFVISAALYIWYILFQYSGQKIQVWKSISIPFVPETAKKHLSTLLVLGFSLVALYLYAVSLPSLLFKNHNLLKGANYVDLHAHMPVIYILIGVAAFIALAGVYMITVGKYKLWFPLIAIYFAVFLLGGGIYPALLQSLVVAPNELSKEHTNIKRNIEATQEAWKLDQVKIRELSGNQELTMEDIQENQGTINNIRLWDRGPLLDTFSQLQEIRTYYTFNSIDTERYQLGEEYQQLSLAPRELDYNNLPKRNFINERLTYTHGMGVAVTPVNKVTEEGLPMLYVKDLPPTSTKKILDIKQPAIYYGEDQSDYVLANTKSKEFHFPAQDENVYRNYTGSGGVALDSVLSRALMAVNFGSYKIFLNTDVTDETRILYNRNIKQRVKKALPFLAFDSDPYLVIVEGRLKWIQDAYTATDHYPYSAEIGGINYMRNSVKVIIDAYTGKIDAYITDREDPLIQTYASIFPEIFQSAEDMPSSIKPHIRYPEDIYSRQTILYAEYHMEDPQDFYNKEDLWTFPLLQSTTRGETTGPIMRRLIMKLPGEGREEYVLMLPYTPEGKNNMISWVAARSDGEHYGELINYRFPKDSLAYGPKQVISRINQKTEISQQISLWDQRGSEVLQGNLYVIPIEESLLYVRPLYLRAQDSRMPELKRVIVAHKDSIAMEPTLKEALQAIFKNGKTSQPDTEEEGSEGDRTIPPISQELKPLIEDINQLFEDSQRAQQQGNWGEYGDLLKRLEDKLRQLQSKASQ